MANARKTFNMDPKKGMLYMMEQGLIQQSPEAVADFLYRGEGAFSKNLI